MSITTLKRYQAKSLTPINDVILVTEMIFGERLSHGGIIMVGDDRKSEGIRPRWGKVFAIGPKQKDVEVGEYILIKHGRWTRGIDMDVNGEEVTIRKVDNNDILAVSNKKQFDETGTTAHVTESDVHRIQGSLHNDGTTRGD